MKNLKRHSSKIIASSNTERSSTVFSVSFLTVAVIALALVYQRFNFLIIHYLIAFLHEMSHFVAAKLFKVHVEEFKFLPFGFYAKIPYLENENKYVQFLIIIAGPLSFFLSYLLILIGYRTNFFSVFGYSYALEANLLVLLFNLIPMYPLDGGRAVELIFANFFDEFKCRIMRICFSTLAFIFIAILCVINNQYIVMIFLGVSLIGDIVSFKKQFLKYLLLRMSRNNNGKIKFTKKKVLYRFRNNIYINENKELIDEKKLIGVILKDLHSTSVKPHQ